VTINTTLLIFCGQKFSYAGGDDEYLANESECGTSLRVRANENLFIGHKLSLKSRYQLGLRAKREKEIIYTILYFS
jgi:hypothetical protein